MTAAAAAADDDDDDIIRTYTFDVHWLNIANFVFPALERLAMLVSCIYAKWPFVGSI